MSVQIMPTDAPEEQISQENAIVASDVRKTYKARHGQPAKEALKGLDLAIPRGSIFGLLGPNGAGKSTFINIMAGLVIKSSGSLKVWGFDVDRNPRQARASIGVVPQELHLDPFFPPYESLEVQAGMFGVPKSERRTMEILKTVGLEDKARAYPRSLSGGMRRRLLIAKAMVHNPPILVLDEPTAGVDIELRQQLWANIRKMHAEGVTIVLTTHYLEEAEEMCDRIAIIDQGQVKACDTTENLLTLIDTKRVIITPDSPVMAVPFALPGVEVDRAANGKLVLTYRPSVTPFEQILEHVRKSGVTIRDLSTEESDLEDIFLRLTQVDRTEGAQ